MRSLLAACGAVLLFSAAMASAATITSISPSLVKVNSAEHFVTVSGSGLGNLLVFDGPAGHFEVPASVSGSTQVIGWVPEAVVNRSGYYSLFIRGAAGDSNSVTFTVQGFKYFPLVILSPDVLFSQALTREGAFVKYEVLPFGGDDPDPVVRCFPESGSFFKMGRTTVNCEASNNAGEKANSELVILVADREAPVVNVPREPIVVEAESREGTIVDFKTDAFDDIYGALETECFPRAGSVFPVGLTTVQCSATDLELNAGYASFAVEVLGELKPYELTVDVPDDIVVDAIDPSGASVKFSVRVFGTDDPEPELTCSHKSEEVFPIGLTSIVCNAIDRWGMRGSAAFNITVADADPPAIQRLIASPNVLPYDDRAHLVTLDVVAEDKIDLRPQCAIFAVTANEDIHVDDQQDPEKDWDWRITGDLTVELRGRYLRGSRTYHVWVGCSDWYGNFGSEAVPVYVTKDGTLASAVQQPARRRAVGKP